MLPLAVLLCNCGRKNTKPAAPEKRDYAIFQHGSVPTQPTPLVKKEPEAIQAVSEERLTPELDFEVENATGTTIYITCFSYIQKEPFMRWRWDKSAIQKLEDGQRTIVNIDTIPDTEHREDIFGYLAIFESEEEAHDSIYELLQNGQKIDLDQLYKLKDKKVVVGVEKYGFKKAKVDFSVVEKFKKKRLDPELDFIIENGTGRNIFVTVFVYQVKDNVRMVWSYDKTAVQKLEPGQMSVVNVDTIKNERDRKYMSGYLAVFDEHEEDKAHDSTYELLEPKNKIALGRLSRLTDQKVVVEIEQYGAVGEITEFDLRPAESPLQRLKTKTPENRMINVEIKQKEPTPEPKNNAKKPTKTHKPKRNRGTYQLFAKS